MINWIKKDSFIENLHSKILLAGFDVGYTTYLDATIGDFAHRMVFYLGPEKEYIDNCFKLNKALSEAERDMMRAEIMRWLGMKYVAFHVESILDVFDGIGREELENKIIVREIIE